MASERLARLIWYDGRIVSGEDMVSQTLAEYHRDFHSRKSIASQYLRESPDVSWVTGGAAPSLRFENIDGFSPDTNGENILPI